MPRIDPTRLLLCLRPLLNFETGGIKSDKEVDKVFGFGLYFSCVWIIQKTLLSPGLMSKFSKKLVSKCTYINILHATSPDILNLFMERGGWGMMHEWVVDAKQSKNNPLLNEILNLLLITPATINRLKENPLPKEIKQISSRWECEESKAAAERIVAKWISIAKNENQPDPQPTVATRSTVSIVVGQTPTTAAAQSNTNTMSTPNHQTFTLGFERGDVDIDGNYDDVPLTDADLNDLNMNMVDFNDAEFFSTIDQHLSELNNSTDSDNSFQLTNNSEHVQFSPQSTNHTILIQNSSSESQPQVVQACPNVPSIVIKTSGGQHSVVKPVSAVQVVQQSPQDNLSGGQGQENICLVTANGQRVILRVQVPNNNDAGNSKQSVVIPATAQQQDQQVSSSGPAAASSSSTPVVTKRSRPRKDPTITNSKGAAKKKTTPAEQTKQLVKTYSKRKNAEETQPTPSTGGGKGKSKEKTKSSTNTKGGTSSSKKSSKSTISAAEQEKLDKLRQQSKEAKRKMKEREEMEKKKLEQDKQKQKDNKTIKEIYGLSTPQNPVPKIPKKKPSFDELIGVPGAKEDSKKEKITKQFESSSEKSSKSKVNNTTNSETNDKDVNSSLVGENVDTGFGLYARPETVDRGPPRERPRHQVKVYTSSKSKNMDLLETMTKGSKIKANTTTDANKIDSNKASNAGSFEDAISGAIVKPGKRPSLDSVGKPGETKKLKLDESLDKKDGKVSLGDKGKMSKDEKKEKESKEKAKRLQGIQESSLFMDALTATRDTSKSNRPRRRRISSSNENQKDATSGGSSSSSVKENIKSPREDSQAQITKPVFNFYRDTLNDDDDNDEPRVKGTEDGPSQQEVVVIDSSSEGGNDVLSRISDSIVEPTTSTPSTTTTTTTTTSDVVPVDDFAPAEGEGLLKSCLCIHRPKGRAKKVVKWREDEELKEYHYFEMDETERVNVSRPKNFSEMKILERSEEKLTLLSRQHDHGTGRRMVQDSMEEQTPWRSPPRKLFIDPSTPSPKVESNEKQIQEERERSILQVFYFPGTPLPDHPSESDVLDQDYDKSSPYSLIPGDDVPGQTKVYDLRKEAWPKPSLGGPSGPHLPPPNTMPTVPSGFPNAFSVPPPSTADAFDSFNPWTQTFAAATSAAANQAPVGNDPWKMPPEIPAFSAFPPPVNPVNLIPQPFGFPQVAFPPPPVGQIFPSFGASQFEMPQNVPMPREDGNRPSRARDMDYRSDLDRGRRNDGRSERRQTDRSDRRDRDRDRDRGRDRERYDSGRGDRRGDRKDRDYRHSDRGSFRRPSNGRRKVTLCAYFSKGYCREGNKCGFLHPGVHGSSNDTSSSSSSRNNKSSVSSPPLSMEDENDSSRNKSPPRKNHDPPSNHSSPTTSTITISSNSSGESLSSGSEIPPIASPTNEPQEPESFELPPSSPSDGIFPPGTEPKVIPTYTDEDWG